jgi:hypothetical protein
LSPDSADLSDIVMATHSTCTVLLGIVIVLTAVIEALKWTQISILPANHDAAYVRRVRVNANLSVFAE